MFRPLLLPSSAPFFSSSLSPFFSPSLVLPFLSPLHSPPIPPHFSPPPSPLLFLHFSPYAVSKQTHDSFIPHEYGYLNQTVLEGSHGYTMPTQHEHFILRKQPQASVNLRCEMLQRGGLKEGGGRGREERREGRRRKGRGRKGRGGRKEEGHGKD